MRNKFTIGLIIGVVIGVFLTSTTIVLAGKLAPTSPPASTSSYTLNDIYNRLDAGTTGSQSTFTEPGNGPGSSTMYTLNDIMGVAPVIDTINGATAADVISGKTFWGLGTGEAWGLQTGTFSVVGQRATRSSINPSYSKVLDGANSDGDPMNDPDTELADVRQLLNPDSSDTLPNIIGVPSGYRYASDGVTYNVDVPYPVSISTLIGTPTYDPFTGLPLTASHSYNPSWVSYNSSGGFYYFNLTTPIALRLRSVLCQLASTAALP